MDRLAGSLIVLGLLLSWGRPVRAQEAAPPEETAGTPVPSAPPVPPASPAAPPPVDLPAAPEPPPPGAPYEGLPPASDLADASVHQHQTQPRPTDLSYGVAMRLRWVTVPSWLLNVFTKKNVPLSSAHVGLELFRRKGNFDMVGAVSYQNMSPPDGNWLGKKKDPAVDTDYVQFKGLFLVSLDVAFVWHAMFTDWLGMHAGAGFGIGKVFGDVLRTSSSADCTEENLGDTSLCHPVAPAPYPPIVCTRNGCPDDQLRMTEGRGFDEPANPSRFSDKTVPPAIPIVNVLVGLDFRVPSLRGWEAKIEGGFFDAFFLGGSVGYTF